MPNSTDGSKVSILAGQTRQVSGDRTAERVASAVSEAKMDLRQKLMAASSAAEAARSAERLWKTKAEYALEAVYELRYQHAWTQPASRNRFPQMPAPVYGRLQQPSHAAAYRPIIGNCAAPLGL